MNKKRTLLCTTHVLHKADYTEMSDKVDAMYRTRGDRTGGEGYADTVQNKMVLFRPNKTITYNHQHLSMYICFGLF